MAVLPSRETLWGVGLAKAAIGRLPLRSFENFSFKVSRESVDGVVIRVE